MAINFLNNAIGTAATFTGDLKVAGGLLFADQSSTRVGIGTLFPDELLHVDGPCKIRGLLKLDQNNNSTFAGVNAGNLTNIIGSKNTAFGRDSLSVATSNSNNVAVGFEALKSSNTGNNNVAIGAESMSATTDSNGNNVAIGYQAAKSTNGARNVAIGAAALLANVNGIQNTAIGDNALSSLTSNGNTALGYQAGSNLTNAQNNVIIGYQAQAGAATVQNQIVIGKGAVGDTTNNSVVIGNDAIAKTILKGNVGIGTASPTEKLHVDGNARVIGAYYDTSNSPGTTNQLLSSTVTGTTWIDPSSITAEAATLVVIACKNTSGATITKGTPVYQTGTVGATATIEIAPADALISANKLPAIGLLQTALNNNGFGFVVITGELTNFTTSPIDGVVPTAGDKIFVKSGGGLTLTKPTGEGNGIQNMGLVGKVSTGSAGSITVSSIMRTNDVPNLPEGRIWVGDGNTLVSNTVYVDEPNLRLGIGTATFDATYDAKLQVTSSANDGTGGILIENYLPTLTLLDISGGASASQLQQDGTNMVFKNSGAERMRIANSGAATFASTITSGASGSTQGQLILHSTTASAEGNIYGRNGGGMLLNTHSNAHPIEFGGSSFIVNPAATFADNLTVTGLITASKNQNATSTFTFQNTDTTNTNSRANLNVTAGNRSINLLAINDDHLYLSRTSATNLYIQRGSSTDVIIDSTGNVGIGTTSPDILLTLNESTNNTSLGFYNDGTDAANRNWLIGSNDQVFGDFLIKTSTAKGGNPISAGVARFYIDPTGNVGIGTTSPDAKLEVASTTPTIRLTNTDASLTSNQTIGDIDFYQSDPSGGGIGVVSKIRSINSSSFQGEAGLAFHTGTPTTLTERMRITSGGNVGIGTTSPDSLLHIYNPNANWGQEAVITLGTDIEGTTQAQLRYYRGLTDASTEAFQIIVGSTTALTALGASGNVGIGTTTPQTKLAIGSTQGGGIDFLYDANNTYKHQIKNYWNSSADSRMDFNIGRTANVAPVTVMSVGYNSNVGIGTTSPLAKLDVIGETRISYAPSNQYRVRITNSDGNGRILVDGDTSSLIFGTSGAGTNATATERMRIDSAGDVGIGTTSPNQKLHVNGATQLGDINPTTSFGTVALKVVEGSISTEPTLGSGTVGAQAVLYSNGLFGMYTGVSNNGDTWMQSQRNDASTAAYNIQLNPLGGNVLIGTQGIPNGTSIYGSAFVAGNLDRQVLYQGTSVTITSALQAFWNPNGLVGTISTSGTTTSYNSTSDYRLKEDLQDFAGLDMVSKIPVYNYKWKSDKSRSYGVMAHELQEVLPDAVTGEKDAEEMQGVDYSKIVPLLIKSIQELTAKVERLEANK